MCIPVPIQGSKPNADGTVYTRCVHCGEVFGPHEPKFPLGTDRQCPKADSKKEPVELPSVWHRVLNYAVAYWKHRKHGQKVLTVPGILNRFRQCSSCDYYNDLQAGCSVCGCYVNLITDGSEPNKLAWASEECPLEVPLKKWQQEPSGSIYVAEDASGSSNK